MHPTRMKASPHGVKQWENYSRWFHEGTLDEEMLPTLIYTVLLGFFGAIYWIVLEACWWLCLKFGHRLDSVGVRFPFVSDFLSYC